MLIFGAPARYVQGPGVLATIGVELSRLGTSAALVVDPGIADLLLPRIRSSCQEAGVAIHVCLFGGESSAAEVERLRHGLPDTSPGVVAAVGGGKCIDAGKALAGSVGARIVTVPTIASNDSPTSHIYVLYDEAHRLLGVERLSHNPDLVLVDTDVIVSAPARFLQAGIGDCLVKKYEVENCVAVGGRNVFASRPSLAALAMARASYDILRADAHAAFAAIEKGATDDAFERVVEACVLMSGLSFENGGLSVAHAMTRGLSAIAETASVLHGLQVAYGVTVQLALEGRDDAFMADHVRFCRSVGLPVSLADLSLKRPTTDHKRTIAGLTLATPHMANFIRPVSEEDFLDALERVERGFGS